LNDKKLNIINIPTDLPTKPEVGDVGNACGRDVEVAPP
jgi:hypothetical protein